MISLAMPLLLLLVCNLRAPYAENCHIIGFADAYSACEKKKELEKGGEFVFVYMQNEKYPECVADTPGKQLAYCKETPWVLAKCSPVITSWEIK